MKKTPRLVLFGVIFLMAFILRCPPARGSNDNPLNSRIQVENGLLTISVKETALIDILNDLADQTGLGFEIHGDSQRKISAKYSKVPLGKGLKRLLSPSSCIVFYTRTHSDAQKTRISKIIVFDGSGSKATKYEKRTPSEAVTEEKEEVPNETIAHTPEDATTGTSLAEYGKRLTDSSPDVREEAINDMVYEYEEAALTHLEKTLLKDGNGNVRTAAAEAIGELESEQGIKALTIGLGDPDEKVREAVVDALGEIGGKSVLPALRKALNDKNEDIRKAAADLIEEVEDGVDEADEARED